MKLKSPESFAKTKMLVTLGPATSSAATIRELIKGGIDGVRLNFSHGDFSFFTNLFNEIDTACREEKYSLSILADLQGPKMRIGDLEEPEIELTAGELIEITTEKIKGTKEKISTSYESFAEDARSGDAVLIDDGLIRLRVKEIKDHSVTCYIENGGILKPRKGMNLPGMSISSPAVTERDYSNLEFALKNRVDYIALSFVRTPQDIISLREWLTGRDCNKPLIAKIEKKEAIDNFDEILAAADGIMIARGDLGVEMPPQQVPVIQKEIIKKCNASGKLVITATQMLESMINNPIPTRAEATDVANAVWDGTDVVMLSGETAVGKYPLRTVNIMNDIIKNAEAYQLSPEKKQFIVPDSLSENLADSVAKAIAEMSRQINASAIIVFTLKGLAARHLSKYRPDCRIIAISDSFDTMNQLNLVWGVTSLFFEKIDKEQIQQTAKIKELIKEAGLAKEGDIIIITAGAQYSGMSQGNYLRFEPV